MKLPSFFSRAPVPVLQVDEQVVQPEKLAKSSTAESRAFISKNDASAFSILPLSLSEESTGKQILLVATTKLRSVDVVNYMKFACGCHVEIQGYYTEEIIQRALFIAYAPDENQLALHKEMPIADDVRLPAKADEPNDEAGKLLFDLIDYAHALGCSDIHCVPSAKGCLLSMRKQQSMQSHEEIFLSREKQQRLVNRAKVLASFSPEDKDKPLDGAFMRPTEFGGIKIRLSIMPTVFGEKLVLRITSHADTRNLNNLGLSQDVVSTLKSFSSRRRGIFIIAGATGSGKTTTAYALLSHLLNSHLSVVSIEDPVESYLKGASQTEINRSRGLTYATYLKSVVRQDPDVIFCGEMRDLESINAAFQVALTGHFVVSTLHAGSPKEVLYRIIDAGVSPYTAQEQLSYILHQQLVPSLCLSCRVATNHQLFDKPLYGQSSSGCKECNYLGTSQALLLSQTAEAKETKLGTVDKATISDAFYHTGLDDQIKDLLIKGLISAECAATRIEI